MANNTKAITAAYLLQTLKDFDRDVLKNSYIEKYETYTDMAPLLVAANAGKKIVQYIGANDTTHNLKNGYFYIVLEDSSNPGTYVFEEKAVQDIPAGVEYSIVKESTAEAGYFATYQLYGATAGGTPAPITGSAKINIPKDFLVKDASIKTVTAADKASGGIFENDPDFNVGDKYIDFVINVKAEPSGGTTTDEHLYLNVKDLVDVYSAGNGIELDPTTKTFSFKPKTNGGLDVDANGAFIVFETVNIDFTTEWDGGMPSV